MRAGGKHGVGPVPQTLLVCRMELSRRDSEPTKIAAHIVQRNQAVIAVKGSIFQAFGHHWAGGLLEFHGESDDDFPISRILAFGNTGQKNFLDEIEDAGVCGRTSTFRRDDCLADVMRIMLRDPNGIDVGPVHRKVCDDLHQRIAQAIECEVAGGSFGKRNARESIGESIQLTGEGNANNEFSAAIGDVVKCRFIAGKISVNALKACGRRGIYVQAVDQVLEIVARRAAHGPLDGQPF